MIKTQLATFGALLSVAVVAACGSQSGSPSGAVGSMTPRSGSGFTAQVMDESFALGGSIQDVSCTVSADTTTHVVVDIRASGAQDLKALYLTLNYDKTLYAPVVVEPTTALGDKHNLLSLMAPGQPGTLQYGEVLVNPDYQLGFSGNAVMAHVSFRKSAVLPVRSVSTPPRAAAAALKDMKFEGSDKLTWSYCAPGDYDQNGVVNIADLTPISKHFHETSPDGPGHPFPFDSAQSIVDGDSNGEINLSDLQPLSKNLGIDVLGGFRVFTSATEADSPSAPDAPNGAGAMEVTAAPLGIDAASNSADRSTKRLTFGVTLTAKVADQFYWVRPYDGLGNAGIASILHPTNVALPVGVDASATQPESGTGLLTDPYVLKGDKTYAFKLTDNADGSDLTTDPGTKFIVTPPAAGSFTGNVLSLDQTYDGDLTVGALFNGLPEDDGSNVYCSAQSVPPGPIVIDKDPADSNWTDVTGDGTDDPHAYDLHTPTFNPDFDANGSYDMTFTLLATRGVGGPVIPNADLDWSSYPPFVPFDPAAFTADATAGTLQAWAFTDGYLFAQDPADPTLSGRSNFLYVVVQSLTP